MDNLPIAARRRETEDRVQKAVDYLNRSEQLVTLQRLYMLTAMRGKMADISHEIAAAFSAEQKERENK